MDITYKADYRAYPYDDIVIDLERGEKLSGDKLAPPVDTNYYCGDGEPRASYERRMTYGVHEDCYMQVSPSSSMAGYYEYMTIYLGEGE